MGLTYQLCVSLTRFVAANVFRLQIHGREHMIEEGPALLAMNHQSFLDPPLAAACCDRQIHFLAKKDLFDIPFVGRLLLPRLNVVGVNLERADMSALKTVIRILRGGGATIIFPEGSRTMDGAFEPAQPGAGFVIAKTLAPVVPMRIFGAFEAFPRSAKWPRRHDIGITIGKPLRFTTADVAGDPRATFQRISDQILATIAALPPPPGWQAG